MILPFLFLVTGDTLFTPQNILRFADYLYQQPDYAAALDEYRRYLFLGDSIREDIPDRIVSCLVHLRRYDQAIRESARILDKTKQEYTIGWINFIAQRYNSSRHYLSRVNTPYQDDARRIIGLGYAAEFRFAEAGKYLSLPADGPCYKSPALGGFFSLFPGGGNFYCGRIGDGVFSFLVCGLSSFLAYYYHNNEENTKFGISLGAAILFYAGNIYGGINSVRNFNYYENQKYREKIFEAGGPMQDE